MALPSGVVNSFVYNGDGQRVQKQDSGGTTNHVWDGQNILLETDGSNIIQVLYSLNPAAYGILISQVRGGSTSWYLFDGLGSTVQLTDNTGTYTDGYTYDSLGNILVTSGSTSNSYRYIGQVGYYYDITSDNYYIRARTYDPMTGRFLSRDPVGLPDLRLMGVVGPTFLLSNDLTSSISSTLYAYVRNNQTSYIDPSGLLLGFNYGNYCGWSAAGPGFPIDALDAACQRHDKCQATWSTVFKLGWCSQQLCDEAWDAYKFGCRQSYTCKDKTSIANCKEAAYWVAQLFCIIPPPGFPLLGPFAPYPGS